MIINDTRSKTKLTSMDAKDVPVGVPFRGGIGDYGNSIYMKFGGDVWVVVDFQNPKWHWPGDQSTNLKIRDYEPIPDHELILRG